jgi:alkyl sulfatase BDS1-like metallo-beta-lactamase superfamily hydrolase
LELPQPFADEASTRGYYGTISHNVKAVYQRYLGYFDGNPAHLQPLPPESAGAKYVELMGGAESVISKAQELFASGEYRFAAEVLNHLIFSRPRKRSCPRFAGGHVRATRLSGRVCGVAELLPPRCPANCATASWLWEGFGYPTPTWPKR